MYSKRLLRDSFSLVSPPSFRFFCVFWFFSNLRRHCYWYFDIGSESATIRGFEHREFPIWSSPSALTPVCQHESRWSIRHHGQQDKHRFLYHDKTQIMHRSVLACNTSFQRCHYYIRLLEPKQQTKTLWNLSRAHLSTKNRRRLRYLWNEQPNEIILYLSTMTNETTLLKTKHHHYLIERTQWPTSLITYGILALSTKQTGGSICYTSAWLSSTKNN